MHDIRAGDTVVLKAHVENGAFPDEYFVTFPSEDGEVAGFTKDANVIKESDGKLSLTGIVQSRNESILTLLVRGSFFTNSGYVKIKVTQIEKVLA